jgi:hypothetical protein
MATLVFTLLLAVCAAFYDERFLEEYLLYHMGRVDTAHNFAPHFYAFRLLADHPVASALLARLAFVPQLGCTLWFAWRFVFQIFNHFNVIKLHFYFLFSIFSSLKINLSNKICKKIFLEFLFYLSDNFRVIFLVLFLLTFLFTFLVKKPLGIAGTCPSAGS